MPLRSKRQKKASALLETSVELGLDEERSRHPDEPTVERPPPERIDDVLPAELEAEPTLGEVAPLDVRVHEVDRRHVEAGDEPVGRRGIGGFVGVDAGVGVEAKAQLDRKLGPAWHRFAPLEAVDAEGERLQEAAALQRDVSPRRLERVRLCCRRGVDLRVDGKSRCARQGERQSDAHRGEAERATRIGQGGVTPVRSSSRRWLAARRTLQRACRRRCRPPPKDAR
jgi:hypothetical protein